MEFVGQHSSLKKMGKYKETGSLLSYRGIGIFLSEMQKGCRRRGWKERRGMLQSSLAWSRKLRKNWKFEKILRNSLTWMSVDLRRGTARKIVLQRAKNFTKFVKITGGEMELPCGGRE
jgi:hypothetical protein